MRSKRASQRWTTATRLQYLLLSRDLAICVRRLRDPRIRECLIAVADVLAFVHGAGGADIHQPRDSVLLARLQDALGAAEVDGPNVLLTIVLGVDQGGVVDDA